MTRGWWRVAVGAGVALAAVSARPLAGQIDYRNLDDDRPVATEDAYPVERGAFEFVLPWSFERERGGATVHAVVPELAFGILSNAQVGAKLALADLSAGDVAFRGIPSAGLFALYNFNTERRWLPALSLRGELSLPVESFGGDAARFTLKGIATRSWGRVRAHVNGSWSFGDGDAAGGVEGAERWSASAALDRTLIRQSLLLIAEIKASAAARGAPTEVNTAAGLRWQFTPTMVVDLGLARRLRSDVGPDLALTAGFSHAFALPGLLPGARRAPPPAARAPAPGSTTGRDEQFYYPGSFNWEFLRTYPEAARLFNAFDYGHAVLYERLLQHRGEADSALEHEYRYLTTDLLVRPPRFAIAEEAVMPRYARVAWRAKLMFDWAHVLHRQIYDAYADERLAPAERDALIERLTDYYLSRAEYAFTAVPKSMALMDDQEFSQVFRKRYEKFNGLIWSYHWLQVGLYEPFIEGRTRAETKAGVQATVARFWSMLEEPPTRFPKYMPMTSAIAPMFSAAHPRAAIIFDNLHMMHDIISDVLSADTVPDGRKAATIDAQLDMLQDPTRDVMTLEEWRNMGEAMGGIAAMGGPATGILKSVVAPVTPPADRPPSHRH